MIYDDVLLAETEEGQRHLLKQETKLICRRLQSVSGLQQPTSVISDLLPYSTFLYMVHVNPLFVIDLLAAEVMFACTNHH